MIEMSLSKLKLLNYSHYIYFRN